MELRQACVPLVACTACPIRTQQQQPETGAATQVLRSKGRHRQTGWITRPRVHDRLTSLARPPPARRGFRCVHTSAPDRESIHPIPRLAGYCIALQAISHAAGFTNFYRPFLFDWIASGGGLVVGAPFCQCPLWMPWPWKQGARAGERRSFVCPRRCLPTRGGHKLFSEVNSIFSHDFSAKKQSLYKLQPGHS
jgi:hypothetical protein